MRWSRGFSRLAVGAPMLLETYSWSQAPRRRSHGNCGHPCMIDPVKIWRCHACQMFFTFSSPNYSSILTKLYDSRRSANYCAPCARVASARSAIIRAPANMRGEKTKDFAFLPTPVGRGAGGEGNLNITQIASLP